MKFNQAIDLAVTRLAAALAPEKIFFLAPTPARIPGLPRFLHIKTHETTHA